MKRTYRSKKDVEGALVHKDILNLNDKSSVFDAFYIQNLKQTKRELSYVSSNQYVVASKKVRKRKYTKRIVKNADVVSKDSPAPSAYLTPDKSIRVNKAFDPFDALLNSSLNTQDVGSNKNDSFENVKPKREHKLYTRQKKKNKPKIINYSSSGTDSEKENSEDLSNVSHNKTDIRKHELLIEKEAKISDHLADESINNIFLKIPRLNNINQNDVNDSLRKLSLTRVTLTDNIQSSILQQSPLSSTPFKEKYRSQSIYKFSPILKSHDSTSNVSAITEKSIIDNNSEILFEDNKESEPELHKTPIKHLSNYSVNLRETSLLLLSNIQENSRSRLFNLDKAENKENHNLLKNIQVNTCNEVSMLHTTETVPFLGFLNRFSNDFISMIEGNDGKGIVQNVDELCVNDSKGSELSQSIIDLVDENINNFETIMQKSNGETEANNVNSGSQDSIKFSLEHLEEKENNCRHLERQTLYDICNNESLQEVNTSVVKVPIVRLERINDSIFFRYHKKMMGISHNDKSNNKLTDEYSNKFKSFQANQRSISEDHNIKSDSETSSINEATKYSDISQNYESGNNLTDEDGNEFKSFQNKTTISENHSIESFSDTSSTNDATKSSIMENDDEISSSGEAINSANEEERCVNFVTTRKRPEQITRSLLSDFEYKSLNCSMEFDLTVCNNLTDNKSVFFNVSKENLEGSSNINSNDEISTLLNHTKKRTPLKENSNTERSVSTNSDESNYYDNDSTDDTSIYTKASNKRFSIKNYSQCAERKHSTRKRSSRISRVIESQGTSESGDHHNNRKIDDDVIEVISSDSAPEKFTSSVIQRNNRLILLSEMNKAVSNKAVEINSTSTDENNEVSLYAFPPNVLHSNDTDTSQSGVNTSCVRRAKKSKRVTSKSTKVSDKVKKLGQTNAQINNNKESLNSKQETVQAPFSNIQKEIDYDSINPLKCIANKSSRILSSEPKNMLRKTILNENPATSSIVVADIKPNIVLEPGKKWERSLSIYRRMTMMAEKLNQSILDEPMQMKGRKYRQSVISTMEMQDFQGSLHNDSINSCRSTFISKPSRSTIKFVKDPNITRVSLHTTAVYDDLKGNS